MILNPGQLELLRDDYPHVAQANISVMMPAQVYCGRISVAPTRGDSTITVANESGNIANVVEGQQVLVSSLACGGREKSTRRFRSRVGQAITLDANGVDWALNDYITVMENWEPRPRFPDILDTAPYTMYKDEDVVYSDANLEPFPVAIMGPPWAGHMDGNTVTIQLNGSDSYAVAPGAAITTYLWQSTGGVINNANVATTYITFTRGVDPPKGHEPYWVYLTVTDDNGKTQTRRTPIWIHDRSGATAPYSGFSANIQLSYDSGATLSVQALDGANTWPLGAMVVLWMEEQFDTVPNSIGGYADREHVKFVGYLVDTDSISIDPERVGELSLAAVSVDQLLSRMKGLSVAIMDVTRDPISWYEYKNLTIARAVHHMWRWHSTLFTVADVWLPISNILRKGTCTFPEGDLLSQAKQLAFDKGIFASIGCNKQGAIYVEVDPQMIAEADRGAIDTVQEITREDWVNSVGVIARERNELPWATLSGVFWDGTSGTPYASIMPGAVPEIDGARTVDDPLQILASQADCNEKVGLTYARANNDIKEIRVRRFAGNYTHLDVYPQEFYELTIAAADNKRGISITARDLIPRSIDININPASSIVQVGAVFEPATINVVDGIPIDYPTSIPTDPPEPSPPATPEPEAEAAALVAFTLGDGVYVARDAGGNWVTRNGDRVGGDLNDRYGFVDPWGPNRIKHASYDPEKSILVSCGIGYIMRSIDAGRHWYDVTPGDPPNAWNDSPAPTAADLTYEMGVSDWHVNGQHYVIAWYQNSSSEYRGYLLHTDDDMASWTHYALGSDRLSIATWELPQIASGVDFWCDTDPGVGNPTRTLVTQDNILVDNGAGGGGQVNFVARADNWGLYERILMVDFGSWFQLTNGTLDGGNNITARLVSSTDTMTIADPTKVYIYIDPMSLNWTSCTGESMAPYGWSGAVDGYPPATPSIKSTNVNLTDYMRYVWIRMQATGGAGGARYRGTGLHRHLMDYIKIYPNAVEHELLPISIDIDKENGKFLYMSIWEGQQLRVRVYDTTLTLTHPVANVRIQTWHAAGGVTRADVTGRSFWHAVKSPYIPDWANYGDKFMVYGGWESAAGTYRHFSSFYMNSDKHFSADAGWGGDDGTWTGVAVYWAGALKWPSQNNIIIVLNDKTPNPPDLWETIDYATNWNNRSTVPMTSGAPSAEFGMAMHRGSLATIAVADRVANEIFSQNTPYTGAWADITPAGSAHTRCAAVHWIYNQVP